MGTNVFEKEGEVVEPEEGRLAGVQVKLRKDLLQHRHNSRKENVKVERKETCMPSWAKSPVLGGIVMLRE